MAASALDALSYDDPTTKQTPTLDGAASGSPSLYDSVFGPSSSVGTSGTAPTDPNASQNRGLSASSPTSDPNASQNGGLSAMSGQATTQPMQTVEGAAIPSQPTDPNASQNGGLSATSPYADLMSQIQSTSDPTQKATLQDQLARQVYSTLQGAGHDVEWNGDTLMVDGRPYSVAGSTSNTGINGAATGGVNTPGAAPSGSGSSTGYGGYSATNLPPGVDATNPVAQQMLSTMQAAGIQPGGRGAGFTDLAYWIPVIQSDPSQMARWQADIAGHGPDQVGPDGIGAGSGGGGGAAGSSASSLYQQIFGTPQVGAATVNVGGGGGGGGAPAASFAPSSPTYTAPPPQDSSDLANTTQQAIASQLAPTGTPAQENTTFQPGQVDTTLAPSYHFGGLGDLGPLGAGRTNDQTGALVSDILAHPESYPPELVDQLKAQSKDEIAQMSKSDQENLTAQANLTGNQDSTWLASQRLARQGQADQSLIGSNRQIDLTAAAQNQKDKLAAATLGQSYATAQDEMNRADAAERLSQQQAAEGDSQAAAASAQQAQSLRQQAQATNANLGLAGNQQNNTAIAQNNAAMFQSQDEQRQSVALAADTGLRTAAEQDNRQQLEEGFKQKATELGISQDQVRLQYTLGLISDATQRYGIDVNSANVRAQLAQAGTEFQQDLIFRIASLAQQNDQFAAQYGLDFINTQNNVNNSQYSQYGNTFGA